MEVAPLQHLSDSFSRAWLTTTRRGGGARAPSFERLVADADSADLGRSFGSSRSSFIDMDPAELFSMRWMAPSPPPAPPESDFDFGVILPGGGGGSDPSSPVMVSASQVIRNGRLLPGYPAVYQGSGLLDHGAGADPPSAPLFRSASAPASPSSCSSGRRGGGASSSSSWKMLLQYLRFLAPLYRKVRALRRFPAARRRRVAPSAAASPARASSSSSSGVEWCHGNADTAVRDAILYCKKSSGQADAYTSLT